MLTTGAIVPIHDAARGDVGPGDDFRTMGYIILSRDRRSVAEIDRESSSWYRPGTDTTPPEWDAACLARLQSAEISLEDHVTHLTARNWLGFNARLRLVTEPGRSSAPQANLHPKPPAASGPAPPEDTQDVDAEGEWPETLPPVADAAGRTASAPTAGPGAPTETIFPPPNSTSSSLHRVVLPELALPPPKSSSPPQGGRAPRDPTPTAPTETHERPSGGEEAPVVELLYPGGVKVRADKPSSPAQGGRVPRDPTPTAPTDAQEQPSGGGDAPMGELLYPGVVEVNAGMEAPARDQNELSPPAGAAPEASDDVEMRGELPPVRRRSDE